MDKIILFILRLIAHLPWWLLYAFSNFLYLILKYVLRYRHKVVTKNLSLSFPEKSQKEIRTIQNQFYHHLADVVVESIKLLHISDEEIMQRMKYENPEVIDRMYDDDRPILVMLGHMGNWEWTQSFRTAYPRPMQMATLYKPLKSEATNRVLEVIRSRFDVEKIPSKQAMRRLLRWKMENRKFMVAFIADQRTTSKNHALRFLNQKTSYYTGGEDIGRHVDAHMLYLDITKPKRGHYVTRFVELDPLIDSDREYPYIHAFMHLLEDNIRREPSLWMWSHNRWKNNHLLEISDGTE